MARASSGPARADQAGQADDFPLANREIDVPQNFSPVEMAHSQGFFGQSGAGFAHSLLYDLASDHHLDQSFQLGFRDKPGCPRFARPAAP